MDLHTIDAFDPDAPGKPTGKWWGKDLKPKGVYAATASKPQTSLAELVDTLEKLCAQKKSKGVTAKAMDTHLEEISGVKAAVEEVLKEMGSRL